VKHHMIVETAESNARFSCAFTQRRTEGCSMQGEGLRGGTHISLHIAGADRSERGLLLLKLSTSSNETLARLLQHHSTRNLPSFSARTISGACLIRLSADDIHCTIEQRPIMETMTTSRQSIEISMAAAMMIASSA